VSAAPVAVIVPVYRGIYDLTRCLESVALHAHRTELAFELILIDDASPEPAVRAYLDEFVTRDAAYRDGRFKVVGDPRVTPVGRVLRRLSLDEVPQLLNVLRGDMSIVGPRPPIAEEYALYDDRCRLRLAVKPGITGLYQVTARSRVPFSQMLAIDLDYIERRSIRLDVAIMLRTIAVMVSGRGAA